MAAMAAMNAASITPVAGVGFAGFRQSVATGGPQAALAQGGKDKSRPVSSTAVAGTPWCVVWTGDNRVSQKHLKNRIIINVLRYFSTIQAREPLSGNAHRISTVAQMSTCWFQNLHQRVMVLFYLDVKINIVDF